MMIILIECGLGATIAIVYLIDLIINGVCKYEWNADFDK